MITIIENGVEFVMESYVNKPCELKNENGSCIACDTQVPNIHEICKSLGCLVCTSAKKITAEPKFYGPHNRGEAVPLVNTMVEYFDGGSWRSGKLSDIMDYQTNLAYEIDKTVYPTIREIKPRHLTWPEIKALHPDLEDVVLVGD